MNAPDTVGALLPLLRSFCIGECGIALGGSYAKECSDEHSDVDIYLFADEVLPRTHRAGLVLQALGFTSQASSWGQDDPWIEGGTDFQYEGRRVECWLRSTREMSSTIAACLRGEIRRELSVWAVMGFFNYAALADVKAMRIVQDPHGTLASWKEQVAAYPEPLRQAIIDQFMAEAAFWPENFHYHTAVERADVIYTSAIVQQVIQALIQVVFALNREYFPGEKGLARALDNLPSKPERFSDRIKALLSAGKSPGAAELREQREELMVLVEEMRQLAVTYSESTQAG